jgi:hypothetical protein
MSAPMEAVFHESKNVSEMGRFVGEERVQEQNGVGDASLHKVEPTSVSWALGVHVPVRVPRGHSREPASPSFTAHPHAEN